MAGVAEREGATAERRGASPGRRCAHRVLGRVFADGAYADRAFRAEADRAGLDPRERAFAQRLAFGAIQRRATLDHVIAGLSSRPLDRVDPRLLDALRLGVFELLYMDAVPDRAAVAQTVELAKLDGGHASGYANAVMRHAAREALTLVAELGEESPAEAAILHSHPEWLVRLWWEVLGRAETLALLARDNAPPENALRVNELLATPADVARALAEEGIETRPAPGLPEGLVLHAAFDLHGSRLFEAGAVIGQSRGSMLVARVLGPAPGERVLDLCAAPGTKTTHLAALMRGRGQLVSVERHEGRAAALRRNCERMGAPWVDVRCVDAGEAPDGPFDRVLLDAPCSDLGTLQARPDARWRKTPDQIERLASEQERLLDAAAPRVRPRGTLVYSTCTISPRENEEQVRAFLARHPQFEPDDLGAEYPELVHRSAAAFLQVLPHRHGTEGFFIARLRHRGTLA